MSTYLSTGIIQILIFAGALMALMQWLAVVKMPEARLRTPKPNKVTLKNKIINVVGNSTIAVGMLVSILYVGGDALVYAASNDISGMTIFGEMLAVLLVYDFMYYFAHRAMHHPKVMKQVHGVHHYIRYPTAFESIYVHPIEGAIGIGLLMLSLVMLGPISETSFLVAFFIYSSVNILVHANIRLNHPIFKLANYWAVRHDIHHGTQLNKNYASIFPFFDQFFDTNAVKKEEKS